MEDKNFIILYNKDGEWVVWKKMKSDKDPFFFTKEEGKNHIKRMIKNGVFFPSSERIMLVQTEPIEINITVD